MLGTTSVSRSRSRDPALPSKREPTHALAVAAQDRSLWIGTGAFRSRATGYQNMPVCSRIVVATTTKMRMRGLEPPPGCPDTDLNRARLPIPPHPREGAEDIADAAPRSRPVGRTREGRASDGHLAPALC